MVLVFVSLAFGLAMLASAGIVESQKIFGSPYYLLKHQFLFGILPGLLLFFVASRINYQNWKKFALPLLLVAIALVVLVFIPQFGLTIKGAQRWVNLFGISFQPSEFLKLAMIAYLAAWFSRRDGQSLGSFSYSIAPFLLVLGFVGALLYLQPDFKTLVLVSVIAVAIYFFAGAKLSHLLVLFLVFAIIAGFALVEPYRFERVKSFLHPTVDTQGASYHINQALLGIGNGGLFGVGYGKSQQKINYLPEPVGDSIYAIIVEELGFVGGAFVLLLFILLALTLTHIARSVNDQFGRLFVLGMTVWIMAQAFVNIGAILNLIPLTGAPLPFFSYGSSTLVSMLAGLGIVRNISKHVK